MKPNYPLLALLFSCSVEISNAQTDTSNNQETVPNSNYNNGSGINPNNYSSPYKNSAGNDNGKPLKRKPKKTTNSPVNTEKKRK